MAYMPKHFCGGPKPKMRSKIVSMLLLLVIPSTISFNQEYIPTILLHYNEMPTT